MRLTLQPLNALAYVTARESIPIRLSLRRVSSIEAIDELTAMTCGMSPCCIVGGMFGELVMSFYHVCSLLGPQSDEIVGCLNEGPLRQTRTSDT
jgi:hypothetical protein